MKMAAPPGWTRRPRQFTLPSVAGQIKDRPAVFRFRRGKATTSASRSTTIAITAPVQSGNSGGPVLDAAGNVVGVVVAKLDAIRIARSTGDIPQNVNFAISAGAARAFLDAEGVPYETAPSDNAMEPVEVASMARKFTVLVECWK